MQENLHVTIAIVRYFQKIQRWRYFRECLLAATSNILTDFTFFTHDDASACIRALLVCRTSSGECCLLIAVLLGRIPQLDPGRSRDTYTDDHEVRKSPITRVVPYQPLKPKPKVELPPLHVTVRYARSDKLAEIC